MSKKELGKCQHQEFVDRNKGWGMPDPITHTIGNVWNCPDCETKFVLAGYWEIEPIYSIQDNVRPSAEPMMPTLIVKIAEPISELRADRIAGGMFIEMSTLMTIKVAINEGFKEINTLETKLFPREVGIQKVRNSFHALRQIFPQEKIEVMR